MRSSAAVCASSSTTSTLPIMASLRLHTLHYHNVQAGSWVRPPRIEYVSAAERDVQRQSPGGIGDPEVMAAPGRDPDGLADGDLRCGHGGNPGELVIQHSNP